MARWRRIALVAALAALPARLSAQTPESERAAVLATVQRLFDAMRSGDSATARTLFHPQALLATAHLRGGAPVVQVDTLESFIHAVGAPRTEIWDERLGGADVRIDGPFASVWAEYAFYVGTELSHCGVDALQLARSAGGWSIVAFTDTRRRTGCPGAGGR